MTNEWEYDDFSAEWDEKQEIGTAGKIISYSDIIQHTWSKLRPELLENLQEWLDKGWEPITPIDADCMVIETKDAGFFIGTKVYLKEIRLKMRRRRN